MPEQPPVLRVLLVGRETPDAQLVEQSLGYRLDLALQIYIVGTVPQALGLLERGGFDLVLLGPGRSVEERASAKARLLPYCGPAALAEFTDHGAALVALHLTGDHGSPTGNPAAGLVRLDMLTHLLGVLPGYKQAA